MLRLASVLIAITGLLWPIESIAQQMEPKSELLDLIQKFRSSWNSGFVHARYSGFLALGESSEAKVWWKEGHSRVESIAKDRSKTLINTPAWSARSNDGKIFSIKAMEDAGHQGFRVQPNKSWLSVAGPRYVPIEDWLESRPVDPLYVRTPNGFAVLFADAADEHACRRALQLGQPLTIVRLSYCCLLLSFNAHGLPVDLSWFGPLPKTTFSVEWEWDDTSPPKLQRLTRTESSDFGRTSKVAAELVVLDASRASPAEGRFAIPDPR